MKMSLVLLTTWLSCLTAAFSAGFSDLTNGIYVTVVGWRHGDPITNEPIRFDDKLVWMPFCNTGKVAVWFPPDAAYGVKIRMRGPDGKPTKKTRLGERFGSKWDKLHSYKDAKLQPGYAWGSYKENPGLGGGSILAAPQELFQLKEPGIYTMEIEIQLFRYVRSKNTEEWDKNLLRFSPIRIRVEKPPDTE